MPEETYRQILTLLDSLNDDEKLTLIADITENLRTGTPLIEETEEDEPERKKPIHLPRIKTLLEWGVVQVGDRIHLRTHPDEHAMFLNKNEVVYDGHQIRINDWAKEITSWAAVNIYEFVVIERTGQLLGDMRKHAMLERGMDYPD